MYTIAGIQFALRPLTLRQRALAAPMEQKLRALIFKLASTGSAGSPSEQFQTALDVSVQLDELQYSEEFPKFLATILTPIDTHWSPSSIDRYWELMWEIDEQTLGEVLRDFFGRASKLPLGSSVSINASMSEQKPSATSDAQSNSAIPTK